MADYTPIADFAGKDALAATDGNRLVKGKELDNEFTSIQTAISTKLDDGFVLPPVDVPYPAFNGSRYNDSNFFTDFGQTYRIGTTVSYTPTVNDSSLLVKASIDIAHSPNQQQEEVVSSCFVRCIVRNNDTNAEVQYGNDFTVSRRYKVEDQTASPNVVNIRVTSSRAYNLIFASEPALPLVAGPSATGYTIAIEVATFGRPNASAVYGTVGFTDGGSITAQEVLN